MAGGLTPFVLQVAWIACKSKRSGPIDGIDASLKIAQRISCTLHRENARAILKRAPELVGTPCRSLGMSVGAESERAQLLICVQGVSCCLVEGVVLLWAQTVWAPRHL